MKKRSLPTLPHLGTSHLDLLERLYRSGAVWLLLYLVFFMVMANPNYVFRAVCSLCFLVMEMGLVAFTNKVLIDKLLIEKNHVVFFILSTILFLAAWAAVSTVLDLGLLRWIAKRPFEEMEFFPFIFLTYMVRFVWFISTYAIVLIFYFQRKENEEKSISEQLKSEKLDMELRYLKSQINPHFLFNALNNIYSMVYTRDDNAADGVLKLSEMLRYVLVDCQAEMIPLRKEINYIENFIDFQMMRMGGHRNVRLEKEVEKEDFLIAPMILQPVIENCFKYSRLETHPDGFITVRIKQLGNSFSFEAENSIAKNTLPVSNGGMGEKKSGIGMVNVQQRLMLHYGENYVFDIQNDKETYKLKIML